MSNGAREAALEFWKTRRRAAPGRAAEKSAAATGPLSHLRIRSFGATIATLVGRGHQRASSARWQMSLRSVTAGGPEAQEGAQIAKRPSQATQGDPDEDTSSGSSESQARGPPGRSLEPKISQSRRRAEAMNAVTERGLSQPCTAHLPELQRHSGTAAREAVSEAATALGERPCHSALEQTSVMHRLTTESSLPKASVRRAISFARTAGTVQMEGQDGKYPLTIAAVSRAASIRTPSLAGQVRTCRDVSWPGSEHDEQLHSSLHPMSHRIIRP